jgi:hypothetical protein
MADNLLEPRLVVNTQARVAGQPSPAMSQSITASYASGQTLNQTLVLRSGQSYSPDIGFSNLVINTTGPVQLLAARGANATFINQLVSQQATIDDAADSFTITNNGLTSVTVKMLILVAPNAALTPVGVVTSLDGMIGDLNIVAGPGISVVNSAQTITINNTGVYQVNGQTGNVSIDANNLPGLATVAITGKYSDLIGAPSPYVLPVATPTVLGGIKVGAGLTITQDGTLSATGEGTVLTVDSQYPDAHGNIIVKAVDNSGTGVSLINDSGATTGLLTFNKLIPGNNMVFTNDSQGNIIITGTVISYTLPVATSTILGGVKKGANVTIAPDGTISVADPYILPVASAAVLGGVKVGSNLTIDANGVLSASYTLPVATPTVLGGIKVGSGLAITQDGTLSTTVVGAVLTVDSQSPDANGNIVVQAVDNSGTGFSLIKDSGATTGNLTFNRLVPGNNMMLTSDAQGNVIISGTLIQYVLPTASTTILGGVKAGSGVTIAGDGTISVAAPYSLPVASATVLGGIKVGANLSIDGNGVLNANTTPYVLPVATTAVLGGVKQGANVFIAVDGTLSVAAPYVLPAATTTTLGGLIVGDNLSVDSSGRVSAIINQYRLPPATTLTLGGVIVGSGLTVDATGKLSVSYTVPVSSVSGQTGAVVVKAIDKDNSTGTSLIYDSGETTGVIKLLRLVAGNNITITPDTVGNLTVSGQPSIPYTLPTATTTILGGVRIGANISVSGNGTISVAPPYVLPVASQTVLGGIKVGSGLTITADGVLSTYGFVTSVNGKVGAVQVSTTDNNTASGVTLIADTGATTGNAKLLRLVAGAGVTLTNDSFGNLQIAASGDYTLPVATATVLGGVKIGANVSVTADGTISVAAPTAPYVLPVATSTVLGGVKQGTGVTIAVDGTISVSAAGGVTSVDGQTGAVVVEATDNNPATGTSLIVDSGATTGDIKLRTVVGGTNIALSTDANNNLVIDGSALAYTLPVATASVLGGVKQGAGVSIAADGTLSVSGTGAVSSVSGQVGDVVVEATDFNTTTGTSLIVNNGATTGNIKLSRLVAGANVTIAQDVNSNLVISSSGSGYALPVATATVLGGVKQGTGVTIAADGTLSIVGIVTSVSGQTGAVVVMAQDNNPATGTSLISDGGATTGIVKLKTLVAGTGVTLGADSNGNLILSATGTASGVTSFNTRTGIVTLTAADISGATGALLSDVAASKYYDIQGGGAGVMTASQLICQHVAVRTITWNSSFGGSQGYAATAATASTTFTISVGGTSIGSMVFAAGATTATFTLIGSTSMTPGQVLTITGPATPDATLANVSVSLLGLAT